MFFKDNYSKLKEDVMSSAMNETEGTSQDVTQPKNQPSDLAIFAQSVGGKKKGRIAGIGSLGRALDDHFSTSTNTFRLMSDDPLITSMKSRMEELVQENHQLKQQQKETEIRYREEINETNAKVEKILQHINLRLP